MFTNIYFIGTADHIRLDPQDNERFKADYEAFLSTGKQLDNQPYRLNGRPGNAYIYFPSIAYIMTEIPPPVPKKVSVY